MFCVILLMCGVSERRYAHLESIEAFVTPVPDPRVGYRHLRCICTVINVLEFVDGISRRALLFIRHVRTAAQFVHVSVRGTSEDASVGTCIRQCTTRLISNSHANSFTAAQPFVFVFELADPRRHAHRDVLSGVMHDQHGIYFAAFLVWVP